MEERVRRLMPLWEGVTRELEAASKWLNLPPAELADFDEFIAQNELELALEVLEAKGSGVALPREFWNLLLSAAKQMGLGEHASRIRLAAEGSNT